MEELGKLDTWKRIFLHKDLEGIDVRFLFAFVYFSRRFLLRETLEELYHFVFDEQVESLPHICDLLYHRCLHTTRC